MKVPFLNLYQINAGIEDELRQAIDQVIRSGWYILGAAGQSFEANLKSYLTGGNAGAALGCNSGTDALILALLGAGVAAGDEVVTVSHTAIPTISAICAVGAHPVFVDVDPLTWVMDAARAAAAVTPKTKAIVAVHLYGNMADIPGIRAELRRMEREDVVVIEDVAQAHGSRLSQRQAGTLGHLGAFSFYPSKNIGALGDGGAVFCASEDVAQKIRMLRNYGQRDRYNAEIGRGINSRLDEMQAAILDVKLRYLDQWNGKKSRLMEIYRREFAGLPLSFQKPTPGCEPGWHLCVIALSESGERDALIAHLADREVQTLIHYPIATHRQKAFAHATVGDLAVTESLVDRIVSLPMHPELTDAELEAVVNGVRSFFSGR